MKILITGGGGLLAGRLATYLSCNNKITILSRKKIDHLFNNENISTHMCTSLENLNDNFLTHDIVIHASGPNYNECNNINLVKKYIEETKHLIDLSILNKSVQKFIFLSSIRAVGENLSGLVNENTIPQPATNYGVLKKTIEKYLMSGAPKANMAKIILRITNGYGYPAYNLSEPGSGGWSASCWSLIAMNVCKQAVLTNKIILKSDGSNFKDFVPIQFVMEVIGNIISDINLRENQIFNISSMISIEVIDFIKEIILKLEEKLQKEIILQVGEKEKGQAATQFIIDNSKIQKFGYFPDTHEPTPDDELLKKGLTIARTKDEEINKLIAYCVENKSILK